jgi:hypothetical protein
MGLRALPPTPRLGTHSPGGSSSTAVGSGRRPPAKSYASPSRIRHSCSRTNTPRSSANPSGQVLEACGAGLAVGYLRIKERELEAFSLGSASYPRVQPGRSRPRPHDRRVAARKRIERSLQPQAQRLPQTPPPSQSRFHLRDPQQPGALVTSMMSGGSMPRSVGRLLAC